MNFYHHRHGTLTASLLPPRESLLITKFLYNYCFNYTLLLLLLAPSLSPVMLTPSRFGFPVTQPVPCLLFCLTVAMDSNVSFSKFHQSLHNVGIGEAGCLLFLHIWWLFVFARVPATCLHPLYAELCSSNQSTHVWI